jgi:pimeloyl-ACP methyl ester carboxylesterase
MKAATVTTKRLAVHLRAVGPPEGAPLVLLHGNLSTSLFFDQTLAALPPSLRGLAPDLRGFGGTEPRPIDATRGLDDFADDLRALLEAPELELGDRPVHLAGWSVGGGVAMRYAMEHPAAVASLTLIAPMSPYGFGGTRDAGGTPCWPDHAGSGAGTANPDFVQRLRARDRGEESDFSPRRVMNGFYFRPPFRPAPEREEAYVNALLETVVDDDHYPGDLGTSPNWPGVAPGTRGMNNAISPRYCDLGGFALLESGPPVLWVRGADDQVVSDTSLFDFGYLGKLGAVPGWPGEDAYPPQPMIVQLRAVLDGYRHGGGDYREVVLPDCGHSPHIERPRELMELLLDFLGET